MTTKNPLAIGNVTSGTRTDVLPGQMVTIRRVDKEGREIGPPIVFQRTTRPYVDDLCDAYNAHRTRDDVEWYVTEGGELKIGVPSGFTANLTKQIKRNMEQERREWIYNHRARQG